MVCKNRTCTESQAYVVYEEDDYINCNVSGAKRRAANTFSCDSGWKFESETTYYFISSNPSDCSAGLKFGIFFENTTNCTNTIITQKCSLTKDLVAQGTIDKSSVTHADVDLNYSITPKSDNCEEFTYTLQVPNNMTQGWYGFGFYGPWTKSGTASGEMRGYAIVVFLCDDTCGLSKNTSILVQTWLLTGINKHSLISDLSASDDCTETQIDHVIEIECDVRDSSGTLFTYLPDNVNFTKDSSSEYQMVFAEFYGKGCADGFNPASKHRNTPMVHKYSLKDMSTNTISTSTTGNTDMMTTESETDGAMSFMSASQPGACIFIILSIALIFAAIC